MTEKQRGVNDLTMKIDVDVSEAIAGLKAIQREARKTTQEMRELETAYEENGKRFYTKWKQAADDECTDIQTVCLSDVSTEYLHRELARREGVSDTHLLHNERVVVEGIADDYRKILTDGPARILVNVD